jgi:cell division protein FtsB
MLREQLPPHKTATFVLPRYKTVYVSVPKAACTSLKWLVAELQGEDPQRFHKSVSREVGRAMTIHRRNLWRDTPMLHDLSDEELAAISSENGWFVFAVVRHPAARLWAGWQSKFLLRDPRWIDEFAGEPWLPRIPTSTADVTEDFGRFVESLGRGNGQAVMRDRHFMAQRELLRPDLTPYTRIYDTGQIPRLLEDLEEHVRSQGADTRLALQRINETPLAPLRSLFTPTVTGRIAALYREDFDAFGYAEVVPEKTDPAAEYPREALVAIGLLAERGERLGDLALRAQSLTGQQRDLRKRNGELRAKNRALRDENKTLREANEALGAQPGVRSAIRRAYRKVAARR